ncbi:unnamed protein product [Bursaphelenchus okinawaensis]|uniref:Piwi domain-containing protein n=1 Tax=Bursaphelenchus okinawaensis TaxID=465554 RepID=A0A811KKE1_9BILA|nr:unnamed protein product [Bursaphelenchus okinawaensis]CAG9106438.1 unnamed protein product [Bursaphelenchus okinawaensis]
MASGPAASLGERMDLNKTMSLNAMILKQRNIPAGSPQAPVLEPGTLGAADEVGTNVYPVNINDKTMVYFYTIKVEVSMKPENVERWLDVTKAERRNEVENRNLLRLAYDVFGYALPHITSVIPNPNMVAYDARRSLYVFNQKLCISGDKELIVKLEEDLPLQRPFRSARITISDLEREACLGDPNSPHIQSVIMAMETLSSQGFMKREKEHYFFSPQQSYPANPENYNIPSSEHPNIGAQCEAAVGIQKICKYVKAGGTPMWAAVLKMKKTPFYYPVAVIEKIKDAFPDLYRNPRVDMLNELNDVLQGLLVQPIHLPKGWPIQIRAIVPENARQRKFSLQSGQAVSIEEYYQQRYNFKLEFPELPLAEVKNGENFSYHPLELLTLCAAQRTKPRHLHHVTANLIRVCAKLPSFVKNALPSVRKMFHFEENSQMKELEVEVYPQPASIPARRLPNPGLRYKNVDMPVDVHQSTWKTGNFIKCAQEVKWAIYAVIRGGMNKDQLVQFAKDFMRYSGSKGIELMEPLECQIHNYESNQKIENMIRRAKELGKCNYVLFVTDKALKIQDPIKKAEQQWDIITQNVTLDTVKNIMGWKGKPPSRLTMDNIVSKFNTKLGGLNYNVCQLPEQKVMGKDDLYIGLTFSLPAIGGVENKHSNEKETKPQATPNVVAYMANDLKETDTIGFTGDYVYQSPDVQQIRLPIIEKILTEVCERFVKNRGGKPKRVFLFRYGVAETFYEMILTQEIPFIKHVLEKLGLGNLVYIVASRTHNVQFFRSKITGTKPSEQNLPYGMVMDRLIVNHKYSEFYLLPHTARLGMAQIPRFAVLFNDARCDMDTIQMTTYCLCFAHQIVATSTGLPTPIYCAEQLADRARRNWNSRSGEIIDAALTNNDLTGVDMYDHVTMHLGHQRRAILRDVRFNA